MTKRLHSQMLFAAAVLMLTSCKAVITASDLAGIESGINGAGAPSVHLKIKTFQGQTPEQWATDSNKNIYTATNKFSYTGRCSRGVASVNIYVGAAETGTVKCGVTGAFSWTGTDAEVDGQYSVRLTPVSGDGVEFTGNDWTHTVVVDTQPPAAPVITSPTSAVVTSGAILIQGTVSSTSTNKIISNDSSGIITYSYPGFTAAYTMTPGETKTFTFQAQTLSGLTSPGVSIKICYLASATLATFDTTGAAISSPLADSNGSTHTFSSITSSPYLMATEPKSATDGHKLLTGVLEYVH